LIAITDLQARVMSESGQTDEAIALLANNLSLSPRNKTLTLLLAELYSKRSEPELAHEILLDLFNIEMPTPNNIRTLANYADQMGSSTLSRYYLAEYSISTGQLLNARIQLESVLQEEDLDISDRDKYQARLDQVIEALDQS
jgi:predicted Zn-dependent protease